MIVIPVFSDSFIAEQGDRGAGRPKNYKKRQICRVTHGLTSRVYLIVYGADYLCVI